MHSPLSRPSNKTTVAWFALLACVAASTPASAVPTTLSFTASLSDDAGPLTNGFVNLRFQLYDAVEGAGTSGLLWEETHAETHAVEVKDGLVFVEVGSLNRTTDPLSEAIFNGAELYLEIAVNGDMMTPRLPILTVPYATRARIATRAEALGSLVPDDVQRRIAAECPAGDAIRAIDSAGGVTCERNVSGDIAAVAAGDGLTGGGTDGSVAMQVDYDRVARADHNHDAHYISAISTGAGLAGGGSNGSVSLHVDFTSVARATHNHDAQYLARGNSLSCEPGSKMTGISPDSGNAMCGPDLDTTYTAGSGLSLSARTFRIAPAGITPDHLDHSRVYLASGAETGSSSRAARADHVHYARHHVQLDADLGTLESAPALPRYHIRVSGASSGKRSRPIPNTIIESYCGDLDGCQMRINGIQSNESVHPRMFLFHYNVTTRKWRIGPSGETGTDGAAGTQRAYEVGSCSFTDSAYTGDAPEGDTSVGMHLRLSTNIATYACGLTIID